MAKRRSTTPKPIDNSKSSSEKDELSFSDFMHKTNEVVKSKQFRIICGVLLLLFTLFTLIAIISFAFTGNADSSILSESLKYRFAHRTAIKNTMGIIGADIAYLLIAKTFGWGSLGIVFYALLLSLHLLNIYRTNLIRAFFACSFWILWGSIVLAMLPTPLILSYSLGGEYGLFLSKGLISYIHLWGTIILLLAILIVFLIAIDKNTIPRLKAVRDKIKESIEARRLRRKLKQEQTTDYDGKDKDNDLTGANNENENENDQEENDGIDSDNDNTIIVKSDDDDIIVIDDNDDNKDDSDVTFTITDSSENESLPTDDDNADLNTETDKEDDENENIVEDEKDEEGEGKENDDNQAIAIHKGEDENNDDIGMTIEVNVEEMLKRDPDYLLKKYGPFDPHLELSKYEFPSLSLLKTYPNESTPIIDKDEQLSNKQLIVRTFKSFNIEIVNIKATIGPTVTLYEIVPKEGTRINRIQTLEKDIMLSLSANGIRIIAPIPGKGTVGIEVPNKNPQVVSMHSVVASRRFQEEKKMRLPVAMGKTITNEVFMFDLAKTPHLLVAGATGQGKSVGLNAIITSLLYKKHPTELKLVLVDPKMVEFTLFEPLVRHYIAAMPDQEEIIITDCQKVINTLNSLVIEMEDRYMLLMDARVRNLEDYNEKIVNRRLNTAKDVKNSHGGTQHHRFLPYLVIIIDEYGDFIMQAGKQVETPIARITQKARAVGMHMILATQRPSVNIVTGVIKANIPTRIAFRTQSVIDSRTVLDTKGAEGLVGKGDMLYSGGTELTRIQCAFVDTPEVEEIVKHISTQQHFPAPYQLPEYIPEGEEGEALAPGSVDLKRLDPMFKDVATYVVSRQEGSTSKLQRAFEIGYNKAGKLSDQLEAAGIVGPNKGPKGRDVLVQDMAQLAQILESLGL